MSDFFNPESLRLMPSFCHLLQNFCINTFAVWAIVHFFYYPKGRRRDYYFTFILLSVSIFMLIYLLLGDSADMGIGAALGLFAIFGIIRYRTESVPIREMTYLFFLVSQSVINGRLTDVSLLSLVVLNLIFVCVVWVCESFLTSRREGCKFVRYDNIDLIVPERYDELVADLEKRLGLKINRVEVGAVDFLSDMTMLRVFYADPGACIKNVDRLFKVPVDKKFDD